MKLDLDADVAGMLPEKNFDRRDFIWSALGASAALAVASSASGQTIVTDANGLEAGDVTIPVKDGKLPAYRAMPAKGGPFSVVVVAMEVFGNNPYIKDVCRRLAKEGYFAISPDVYARKADLAKITNFAEIMPIVQSKPDTEMMSDMDAAVAYAKSTGKTDTSRLAITGFCRGGRTTLMYAAHNPQLEAAVAWYGPVTGKTSEATPANPMDLASKIKVPLLGLYGAKDAGIPLDQAHKFFDAVKANGTPAELVVYPDAGHGFHADFRPDSYRKADAEDGWKRMLAWFKKYGL